MQNSVEMTYRQLIVIVTSNMTSSISLTKSRVYIDRSKHIFDKINVWFKSSVITVLCEQCNYVAYIIHPRQSRRGSRAKNIAILYDHIRMSQQATCDRFCNCDITNDVDETHSTRQTGNTHIFYASYSIKSEDFQGAWEKIWYLMHIMLWYELIWYCV